MRISLRRREVIRVSQNTTVGSEAQFFNTVIPSLGQVSLSLLSIFKNSLYGGREKTKTKTKTKKNPYSLAEKL